MDIPLLISAFALVAATILMSFLNGDCGPGLKRPRALRKLLEAPCVGGGACALVDVAISVAATPVVPGVLFVSAAQLEMVMAELRGLVSALQPGGAVSAPAGSDGDEPGKLPTRRQSLNCEAAAADVEPAAARGYTPTLNAAAAAGIPRWSTTGRP